MSAKILVVDDATFIRDMVKKQLRDHLPGVEIFDAVDGVRALVVLKHNPIDIILSDWEMPIMTGEELLRQVRASDQNAKTPFIMITSRGDRDHVVKAVQAGVSDYITKPFSAEELIRKVQKQLKIIGKLSGPGTARGTTQGIAAASVSVLTGTAPPKPKPAAPVSSSLSALMGGGAPAKAAPAKAAPVASGMSALLGGAPKVAAAAPVKAGAKGKAQLRFSDNRTFACVIREMSLQMMSCVMQRADNLPTIFEQAVADIDMGDAGLARINAYIHSITAGESRPDSNIVKIVVRFVDDDADKFEILSKFIAQM